jgi:hypothetical protein
MAYPRRPMWCGWFLGCVVIGAFGCGRIYFDPLARDAAGPAGDAELPVDSISSVGCSDGTREGFVDVARFADIAGCESSWAGAPSLRAATTGTACGNDLGICSVPADACAVGWHVCLDTGDPLDLSTRATAAECLGAGPGTFAAASSHCHSIGPCDYTPPLPCLGNQFCGEPVCCGAGCNTGTVCPATVHADTRIAADLPDSCGALPASVVTGVLCCAN